ncbi:MAG: sigma-70 family RNA polymerase sigma factor, partial [Planctomycetota bacterium]|nr:sigma-70 family RNA polymerase sigma factor [Planctomycetota bacterium]
MKNLKALVIEAQNGDMEAYAVIVRRFQDMAYGFAYSNLGDFHLAQDAAQEAFIEALRDLTNLREPSAFPGWFRRIVYKHCDRLTRRKRVLTVSLDAALAVPSRDMNPARAAENRQMEDKVLAAVAGLPDDQRMVTTLFYVSGYSQKEIAKFLDLPVTTVKKRLASSRDNLKQRMITMVDETLKSFPLPERFADVVVQTNFVTGRINPLADGMRSLSDERMIEKTSELRSRLSAGEDRDSVKAEAFALVREASRRSWGQPHYDVQLVAGMILDQGWIAEEAAGEGKTITCYPAAYMAVLDGMHVHVATVNDYLAKRDAELAREVFKLLGVTVGYVNRDLVRSDGEAEARRRSYQCDITYGSNSEFGFDYLRDTMRQPADEPVQGPLDFAIIDEADSLLIDEARTPLIISGPADVDPDLYQKADGAARSLIDRSEEDGSVLYERDPRHPLCILLTAEGLVIAEEIAAEWSFQLTPESDGLKRIENALRAHLLYEKDKDYVVREGCVVIVDEYTGRLMAGRRWSEGLHQAIEFKEGVEVQRETRTLASITFGEYFKRYKKLAGLTGTAKRP